MICTKFFSFIPNFFYFNFERKQSLLYEKAITKVLQIFRRSELIT